MQTFAIRTLVNAVALWLTALVVPGIQLGEEAPALSNRLVTIVIVAVIFGVINAVIKPVVSFFSLPFIVLTLGLFTIIVNALMLAITSWIAGGLGLDFHVDGFFWSAVLGALVLSFISMLLSMLLPDGRRANATTY